MSKKSKEQLRKSEGNGDLIEKENFDSNKNEDFDWDWIFDKEWLRTKK
ncbi:MAG: hypothetical protein ACFE85_17535 [Candidatus Hodarchaeota archaeon]